jgi:hypothetical protein
MRNDVGGTSVDNMSQSELERRAGQHANEAERLLAARLGLINNVIKVDVHTTLAVYYATIAQRSTPAAQAV